MYDVFMQLMEEKGVTAYRVAKDTGITQATLSRWKTGRVSPSIETLQVLAEYFGVTIDYLMGNTHAEEQTPPKTQKAPTLSQKDERDIKKKMYEIFAQLCKQHGVTPYKVSKETGVSQPTLSEWKKGTYTPKQDKLQKIADYFGVTLDYLMGNTHADRDIEEIDIAIELEEMMQKLESDGSLMFDGNPASPEAIRSIKTALEIGLRYARDVEKGKSK